MKPPPQQKRGKYRLLPESKEKVKKLVSLGFPLCLGIYDSKVKYPRHCNSCIKYAKRLQK